MAKKRMESNEDSANINETAGNTNSSMQENLEQMKKNATPENNNEVSLNGGSDEAMLENGDLNGIIFTSGGLEYDSTTD